MKYIETKKKNLLLCLFLTLLILSCGKKESVNKRNDNAPNVEEQQANKSPQTFSISGFELESVD